MATPTLGYWDIRGNTEPIRMVLHYAEAPFEDKRYEYGSTPQTLRSIWLADKPNLGLDFPNLPYYIDGDLKLTQVSLLDQIRSDQTTSGSPTHRDLPPLLHHRVSPFCVMWPANTV
jgi:hypothetical protein